HGRRRAAAPERYANADLGLFHHALAVFLAIADGAAAVRDDQNVVEPERHAARIEILDRRVADRAYDSAQIRIGGEKRCLHQRRIGDRARNSIAFAVVAYTVDDDGDEFGRPLAVAHDRLRQLNGDELQRIVQGPQAGIVGSNDRRHRRLAGGHEYEAVVGRSITVDGDAIERRGGEACRELA